MQTMDRLVYYSFPEGNILCSGHCSSHSFLILEYCSDPVNKLGPNPNDLSSASKKGCSMESKAFSKLAENKISPMEFS